MRAAATQALTDGELFYVIEHGIRFTGMPALVHRDARGRDRVVAAVHAIRHLPRLTAEEKARMDSADAALGRRGAAGNRRREFLNGGDEPPPATHAH